MRHRLEVAVVVAVAAFALAGLTAWQLLQAERATIINPGLNPELVGPLPTIDTEVPRVDAVAWFESFRMYCNPVQIDTRMRWAPAPGSEDGTMFKAACYALAGRIDDARAVIETLPPDRRYHAAGVVFNVGHPAADAGDELAAGPLMELVVEYWPNHYMALYHAGAAAFERGELDRSEAYLERFLQEYHAEDGWHVSAVSMLETIASR